VSCFANHHLRFRAFTVSASLSVTWKRNLGRVGAAVVRDAGADSFLSLLFEPGLVDTKLDRADFRQKLRELEKKKKKKKKKRKKKKKEKKEKKKKKKKTRNLLKTCGPKRTGRRKGNQGRVSLGRRCPWGRTKKNSKKTCWKGGLGGSLKPLGSVTGVWGGGGGNVHESDM